MRPLIVQVPENSGSSVVEMARKVNGKNIFVVDGSDSQKKFDVVFMNIPNREIESLIDRVNKIEQAQITLLPQGVMALYPPIDQAPEQVTDVQTRSPIEIFLSGLQSIGSWKGFVGYAIITSFVVWIGLFTNTSYLLVAAMLIAPFAGPAMNTAIATARGDWPLMKQGLIRYFVSIIITIAGAWLLSIILKQDIATPLMVDRSQVSSVAVLLALSAGAAGALNLIQSERDSLVSGAAVGMLVAASLAPPAGVVGMAAAIGKWEMVRSGIFLLLLQLIGINLTGSLVFRLFGLKAKGPRYSRGKGSIFISSLLITSLLLGGILYLQLHQSPDLQRSSRAQRAAAEIHEVIENFNEVQLVEANVRFTRANIEEQHSLLSIIYVQKSEPMNAEDTEHIETELRNTLRAELTEFSATPLIDITFLE